MLNETSLQALFAGAQACLITKIDREVQTDALISVPVVAASAHVAPPVLDVQSQEAENPISPYYLPSATSTKTNQFEAFCVSATSAPDDQQFTKNDDSGVDMISDIAW